MPTRNQLVQKATTRQTVRKKGTRSRILKNRPQRKGICYKVTTMKPKKPNSSNRKIAKVRLVRSKRRVTCSISGQGHNLRDYSQVLIRGGRVPDLPGVQYRLVKGKYDFSPTEKIIRIYGRSKYGLEKLTPEAKEEYKQANRTHISKEIQQLPALQKY
jgi:small subunit ribosomal protein S12